MTFFHVKSDYQCSIIDGCDWVFGGCSCTVAKWFPVFQRFLRHPTTLPGLPLFAKRPSDRPGYQPEISKITFFLVCSIFCHPFFVFFLDFDPGESVQLFWSVIDDIFCLTRFFVPKSADFFISQKINFQNLLI